ncbi:unnamed protein product [Sphagnum balticum]
MIVRTYQRRNRIGRRLSDGGGGDGTSASQQEDSSRPPWSSSYQEAFPSSSFPSSSQVLFSHEIEGGAARMESLILNGDFTSSKSLKHRCNWSQTVMSTGISGGATTPATSTLLEAQESGEMMEHMDEANFALDGLRPEQPLQIQRASLQSLLSLCGSIQCRRILRTHSLVKPLLDAVVALPTDDPPLALAAAAVLYFLALDGQNEELFDSTGCVQFLMRLLGSSLPQPPKKSLFSIGNKLAGLGARMKTGNAGMAALDQGGAAVVAEVHELFAREEKTDNSQDEGCGYLLGQELTAKWLALLTLEKACLSTVVLEDTSGAARKVDGCFKERLRELGGLDIVCNLAASCLKVMGILQDALEGEETEQSKRIRDFKALEKCEKNGGVGMLLRCLRVIENVTFLSELNQRHLLELRLPRQKRDAPVSFIGLVISTIKMLSDIETNSRGHFFKHDSAGATTNQWKAIAGFSSLPDLEYESSDLMKTSPSKSLFRFRKPVQNLVRPSSSMAQKCSDAISNGKPLMEQMLVHARSQDAQELVSLSCSSWFSKRHTKPQKVSLLKRKESTGMEDSQDPFAFDEVDLDFCFEEGSKKKGRKTGKVLQLEEVGDATRASRERGENSVANKDDGNVEGSFSSESCREASSYEAVYTDCLLSAVKVLMNLTNDNPVGCFQVAACGGLGVIASLLVAHFPNPQSGPQAEGQEERLGGVQHGSSEMLKGKGGQADQHLDLVVVALGVLCNLVEKDEGNRAHLATLEVELPSYVILKEGSVWHDSSMIALLCALFLSKHGAGEAANAVEEKIAMETDIEAKFKQGEREAEDMIVEAYAALLLAFLSRESDRARLAIAQFLPGDDLTVLVPVLEQFVAFHLSLNMLSQEAHDVVKDVIDSCRQPLLVMPLLV